jgi:phospho-N-acetylmuramoyl-pentapeptide-transferase
MTSGISAILNLLPPFVISMAVTAVVTWRLIPELKKLNTVQNIYEDAPETHQAKQGTPTMGGIAIIVGIVCASVYIMITSGFGAGLLTVTLVTVGFGLIGLVDDYTKKAMRRNKGLTPKQKLALQIALSVAFALCLVYLEGNGTTIVLPFVWKTVDIGWLVIPYMAFILVAMSNAVNLTDGLDGLCAGTSGIVTCWYPLLLQWFGVSLVAAQLARENPLSAAAGGESVYLEGSVQHGIAVATATGQVSAFFFAIAGACVGFMFFNRHPAKIFMGDTGSLALGGAIAAAAIWSKAELLLPLAGLIFVLEALSVIIQVASYRFRHGKRVFRMAPLHHHFELSGWKETKVVKCFFIFTVIPCGVTQIVLIVLYGMI